MDEAPETRPPNVSDDSSTEMQTDEEEEILGPQHDGNSSSDEDGLQHV